MIARDEAINAIASQLDEDDLVITTTGMISREAFSVLDRPGNFYMLGSMGLASALGLGLALLVPRRRVFVLEGDGSALMSLGALPLIGAERPPNLVHVVLDNEAYESTGAQPSITTRVDLAAIGRSSGYRGAIGCEDQDRDEARDHRVFDRRVAFHVAEELVDPTEILVDRDASRLFLSRC